MRSISSSGLSVRVILYLLPNSMVGAKAIEMARVENLNPGHFLFADPQSTRKIIEFAAFAETLAKGARAKEWNRRGSPRCAV
jgi:hypothetical protein